MNTYIALFRGINVGGKHILPMKNLVKILESLDCKNIKTYIQSGNVVFQIERTKSDNIAEEIGKNILKQFGFEPKVLLLDSGEFQEAVKNNPFETNDGKTLHFFFLSTPSEHPSLKKMAELKSATEEFQLTKKVFYLFAPEGIGRSKLAAKAEQLLGVPVTARNWNTISKLSSMIEQTKPMGLH